MNSYYNQRGYGSGMRSDVCDGCMNGCSLSMPGCDKGKAKARVGSSNAEGIARAQQRYLERKRKEQEAALQKNTYKKEKGE